MLEKKKTGKKKLSCKIGLHSYKDEIILGTYNSKTQEVPAILREKCQHCGKIRNELKGRWRIPIDLWKNPEKGYCSHWSKIRDQKGKNDGTERFTGPETSVDGKVS